MTYGSIGQTGGQDNSGTADNPPVFGTFFTNQAESGYFADVTECKWWWEGGGVLDGANSGFYGFYPHTDSTDDASYSYADPTSDDRFERGYNMVLGVQNEYHYAISGDSNQKLPLNIQSNITTNSNDSVGARQDKEWYS